jgi:hypothetical protein
LAYSPHELKKAILRGFPVFIEIYRKEKEPEMGIFPLKIQTLSFPLSSKGVHGESTLIYLVILADLIYDFVD